MAAANAKAIAAMWAENGTLSDEQGQTLKGRETIEDEYAALFKAEPKAKMVIETGLYNLTKDQSTAPVHLGPDTTEPFVMVRMKQPDADEQTVQQSDE